MRRLIFDFDTQTLTVFGDVSIDDVTKTADILGWELDTRYLPGGEFHEKNKFCEKDDFSHYIKEWMKRNENILNERSI